MKIIIPEPQRFFCEADEDHFFGWLKEIDAIQSVSGSPDGLELEVNDPVDKLSFYELVGLLNRYDLDRRCLRPLCIGNPDSWFNDRKNYWYPSVFGEDG